MKRIVCYLFVVCFILAGCQDSIEKRIEKSFKSFGKENFASKNSIRDITLIEPIDTMLSTKLAETAKECMALCDTGMFIGKLHIDSSSKYFNLHNNKKVPKHLREKYLETIREWYYFCSNTSIKLAECYTNLEKAINDNKDTLCLIEYKIKARIKENGTTNVKEYYAIIKNDDYENIIIQDHNLTVGECPESVQNIMEAIDDFMKFYSVDNEYYMKTLSLLSQCDPYLE